MEASTAADGTPVLSLYGEPPAGSAGAAMTRFLVSAVVVPTGRTTISVRGVADRLARAGVEVGIVEA